MNKIKFGIIFCLLFCVFTYAQQANISIKVNHLQDKTPIQNAEIELKQLDIHQNTNKKGILNLQHVPFGKYIVRISAKNFKEITDTLFVKEKHISKSYFLDEENEHIENEEIHEKEIEKVTIKAIRNSREVKNIPTRVEFINNEELMEKAIMNAANISMVLRESTGIQIQQTSLSSGNSTIRIQGLDGRYTQILKDGFPLFSGFSGGLSINQIPPLDLQQFEIIKGSSSTLYGGGAISGLVNLVSKTPKHKPELNIQLAQTHAGGSTINIFYSRRKNKFGYTLYGSGTYQKEYNPDEDHFSNLPRTKTISFNPKLFYYFSKNEKIWLGFNGTLDKRIGGDLDAIKNGKGGIHQYVEDNISKRFSSQLFYQKKYANKNALHVKSSIAYFDRVMKNPETSFSGQQWDSFSEINYSMKNKKSDWILGANFYTNQFKERDNSTPRNQNNTTLGAFINSTTDLSKHWILEVGLRGDYTKDWGFFALPRVSLLWKLNRHFSSRLGGGMGYKTPDIFTEEATMINFKNISPMDKNLIKSEQSYGSNLDFNYKGKLFGKVKFSINQLFYITRITDALLLNENTLNEYSFTNANKGVLSRGMETNIKFGYHDFKWFLNYAYNLTTLDYLPNKPQKFLTPKHQAGSVFMYENNKWTVGYETYYIGKQMLSTGKKTRDFITMGLMVQRKFKWGSPYINFENFTDRRQSRFSPETLPPHANPQFTEIYAPTDGFIFTAGVLLNVFGSKGHHH